MNKEVENYLECCFNYANQMICKDEKIKPETLTLILNTISALIKSNTKTL
jgi:hypothetical protein